MLLDLDALPAVLDDLEVFVFAGLFNSRKHVEAS
jgi:hypothetical protein